MSTSLPVQRIAADVCVAPQLSPAAMAEAAAAGFRSVINNRPDFEHGPDQPTSTAIEAAARAAGLAYAHLPVAGGYQSPDEIARFAALIAAMPRPLLCFCRSGARSTKLYVAATQAG
ncbi:TIGR01244 family sulfur transferase [Sphaerotilus sp.]|uniref:TIGR01244 family sulfur transferase n=1 Tax=Sphaerotilus sp. TaxID=2093942 RepID=UPI002ACD6031|nr:TIGR01244 family sulfur transferase [Sphaerotilus sp.]MDZ7855464.1 TIGR01244 family sulfur transferase [Sphaerotilus sp.]